MMSGTNKQDEGQTSDTTNGVTVLEEVYTNEKLPEEIFGLIFQKIEHLESQLNCRLICKYWKSTFDRSRLMRQLTFKVNDWRLFNESTIILENVKSICFNAPFKVTKGERKNEWLQFCKRIGSSVEKIKFDSYYDYDNNHDNQQAQLINSLISSCVGLKELHINEEILECLQKKKYENIETLVFTTFESNGALAKALFCFPNLVKIDASLTWISDVTFTLLEYAKASASLKEIIFRSTNGQECFHPPQWLKFIFTCGNLGIIIKIKNNNLPVELNSTALSTYVETDEAPINEVACQIFQSTSISFAQLFNPLATDRIGYCRNISMLSLIFWRPASFGELQFLSKLQKLEKFFSEGSYNVNHANVNFAAQIFEFAFPNLTCLKIEGDVFGHAINEVLPSFSTCFRNLKRLRLRNLKIVPSNIFVLLSKLELLEEMKITRVPGIYLNHSEWTDDKFILPCESQRAGDNDPELVPAIMAFKNLTKLSISGCDILTDVSVVHGIALSKTLKEVSISGFNFENPSRLTETSLAALEGSKLYRGDFTWKA